AVTCDRERDVGLLADGHVDAHRVGGQRKTGPGRESAERAPERECRRAADHRSAREEARLRHWSPRAGMYTGAANESVLSPQQETLPSFERAHARRLPAAIASMSARPGTICGVGYAWSRAPSPSRPAVLSPQHATRPSTRSAQVKPCPLVTRFAGG